MTRLRGKVKRICYIKDHICHIPLNNGQEAICDEDRFEEVKDYSWSVSKNGYVQTRLLGIVDENKSINLHRLLYPEFKMIDHINNNTLDNRSCNLRECTPQQNNMNRRPRIDGYKGVSFKKHAGKWEAYIQYSKKIHIGYFSDPKEAALAYNKKAVELFGEFANLNII